MSERKEPKKSPPIGPVPADVRNQLVSIDTQAQLTAAVMILAFLAGLVSILPQIRNYPSFLPLTWALILIYVSLAFGFSFSIWRFGLFTWKIWCWYLYLKETYSDFQTDPLGIAGRILFTKENELRSWLLYTIGFVSFVLWIIVLIGKMLVQ